jgi:CRP/FNR family nitrogen fixation transcriptional regulator
MRTYAESPLVLRVARANRECAIRGPGAPSFLGSLYGIASFTRRNRDQPIVKMDMGQECWHQLIRGAARQCASLYHGQRQIIDFILPGDVFIPAMNQGEFALEAINDNTIVASVPRREIEQLAGSTIGLGTELDELALAGAYRLQKQILILGRASAVGKVSAFLLDMATRLSVDSRCRFDLPMSRYDIADYLVMSVETVSRALTTLRSREAIEFFGRRGVTIVDRAVLEGGARVGH